MSAIVFLYKMSKIITNKRQMDILVRLMEENPDIAKGICVKSQAKHRWEKFASELNGAGPPMRTWEKWLKVWTDFKFNVKKKMSQNKIKQKATGGGPNKLYTFSQLEETVIRFLDINTIVNPPGLEFGTKVQGNNKPIENEDIGESMLIDSLIEPPDECTPIFSNNTSNTKTSKPLQKKKQSVQDRLVLLEKSTNTQEAFYNEMIDR